jgi:hypothetical protein
MIVIEDKKLLLLNILRDSTKQLGDEIQQEYGDFVVEKLDYKNNDNVKVDGFMVLSSKKYAPNLERLGETYQNKHRYYYYEKLNSKKSRSALFIMFNPSKANPKKDDQTIRNCRTLVKKQYKSMEIINLFSERNPVVNLVKFNKNNSLNKIFIEKYLDNINDNINEHVDIILAWGYGKEGKEECSEYIDYVKKKTNELKTNKNDIKVKYIQIDPVKANENIHHPASSAWSGMGDFEQIAVLSDYQAKEYEKENE